MEYKMNYLSVLVCILMVSVNSFGQKDSINKVDANNLKQGYWVVNDENGKKAEEGKYANNLKTGIWKGYYADGAIKQEITFVENKPDGYAKFYYQTGIVSEEGIWKGNKWVGEYKYNFPNGKPSYEWKYSEQGKRTGVQKYYHENGKIMIEGEWNEGKEAGTIKEFDDTGKLVAEKTFNNGQLDEASVKIFTPSNNNTNQVQDNKNVIINENKTPVNNNVGLFTGNGFNVTYTKDRKKEREGDWKDGKLIDGKRYYYDETGKLTKTSVYKNGNIVNIIYND